MSSDQGSIPLRIGVPPEATLFTPPGTGQFVLIPFELGSLQRS